MATRLGVTGDVMLGRLVDRAQRTRPVNAVWGTMLNRLRGLDGLFINLECCLSTRGKPWRRTPRAFHFRADPDWAVPALRSAGVDCCALANNHILDYEERALLDTLDHLDDGGIAHAGAGRTERDAFEPAVVSVGALDVACVAFADDPNAYAATPEQPGTAYIEVDETDERTRRVVRDALTRAKAADPDLLVASLHWGPNMAVEPPERFQEFVHWLVEAGVDLVHGHSAHVFHGVEVWNGRPILYDTGDFVDDYAVDPSLRNDRSFLFEVVTDTDGVLTELRLTPTEIRDQAVYEASSEAAAWSRSQMQALSEPFDTRFYTDGGQLVCPLRE